MRVALGTQRVRCSTGLCSVKACICLQALTASALRKEHLIQDVGRAASPFLSPLLPVACAGGTLPAAGGCCCC